jgi:uncharacterized protein YhaN
MIRLRSLGLDVYGLFEGRSLSLGRGLTVVSGPNEAGKTTALQALADVLWGLPTRHWLRDLTPRAKVRLCAEVETLPAPGGDSTDGAWFALVRTHRGLHSEDGEVVENPWGADSEATRRHWLTALGLTHEALREGGRLVCAGGGDLAELVFTARRGRGVQSLLTAIEQRADQLFKDHRGNKNVQVRIALAEYRRSQAALESAQVRASQVSRAEADVAELTRLHTDAEAGEMRARRAVDTLTEHARCLAAVQQVRQVRADIAAVRSEGVVLDPAELSEHDDALADLARADDETAELTERLRTAAAELDDLVVDESVLADGARIDAVWAQAEARAGDRQRAEVWQQQAEQDDRRARGELEALLGGPDPRELDDLLEALTVPADLAAQLDEIAGRFDQFAGDRAQRAGLVQQARAELQSIADGPALPDRGALASLQAAVDALAAPDSARARLLSAREEEAAARRRLRQAMLDAGSLDPGADAPTVPTEEEIEVAIGRLSEAREARERAAHELQQARGRLAAAERNLPGIAVADQVEPGMLARARTLREELWADISQDWLAGTLTVQDRPRLAEDYVRRVRTADTLADRLIDQAAADARLAQASQGVEAAKLDVDEQARASHQAIAAAEGEESAWGRLWTGLGVGTPTTTRAQAVRQALLAAATATGDVVRAGRLAATAEPEILAWNCKLTEVLDGLGRRPHPARGDEPGADGLTTLDHLLATARSLIKDADQARELHERRRLAQQALTRAQEQLAQDEEALAAWAARWRDLAAAAGLPATIEPVGWAARRDRLHAAREAHRSAEQKRNEARTARQAWGDFTAAVIALGTNHGLAGTPEQVMEELHHRLTRSRADQRTHNERTADITSAGQRLATLEAVRHDARARLDRLSQRHSMAGEEARVAAVHRGRRLVERTGVEAQWRDRLVSAAGPGRDPEVLVAALADVDDADLEVRAAGAREDLERARQAREARSQELAVARDRLAELKRRGDTVDLSSQVQEALAAVANATEQYVILHVQRLILRQALELHAAQHTSPLLELAGRLLEQLTGGRWVALQAEDDGAGTRALRVVRDDGEPLPTGALSEGTADQVFLALRLAGILHLQQNRRAQGQAVLPVVLDDVLMAFDDDRARRAVQVLADAAVTARVQIVLFTHHRHLADLAGALNRDDIRIEQLEAQPPSAGHVDPETLRSVTARSSGARSSGARSSGARSSGAVAASVTATPNDQDGGSPVSRGPSDAVAHRSRRIDPSLVRAWAREHGEQVSERGRLPADLTRRYLESQG